jgi:hypothetical protein
MSKTLDRAVKETVLLSPDGGVDDDGRPVYGTAIAIQGRVVRGDEVVRLANGSEIKTFVTIWIPGTEDPLPTTDDRIVLESGLAGIVVERTEGKTLSGVLDHVRIKAREE